MIVFVVVLAFVAAIVTVLRWTRPQQADAPPADPNDVLARFLAKWIIAGFILWLVLMLFGEPW